MKGRFREGRVSGAGRVKIARMVEERRRQLARWSRVRLVRLKLPMPFYVTPEEGI